MTTSSKGMHCPKCNGAMVQGFIFAREHGGVRRVINWVEGAPDKAFWTGTKTPAEKCIAVGTFCCSVCGFLESYAHPQFAAR